jgi:hypothetical protein
MRNYVPNGQHSAKDHYPTGQLSGIALRDRSGRSVSLHRYVGRWLVLRVSDLPNSDHLLRCCRDLDGVVIDVVTDEGALPESEHFSRNGLSCLLDGDGSFPRWFPALQWPATFVIDPSGKLIAILTDETCEPFMRSIGRCGRSASTFGAVDLGDIDT